MMAPPAGLLPLPRGARGPLSIPYRLGTPTYRHEVKTRSMACYHMLSRVRKIQTLPPY
jgi:hypothetical protein